MIRTFIIAIAALVFTARVGRAEPPRVVLAVDGKTVYVELGARDGVGAGTTLELLHEVVVRDPQTGKTLRDHFALGTLVVVKSGDRISVAQAEPEIAKRVLAGDRVRVTSALRKFADPWVAQVERSKSPGTVGAPTPVGPMPPTTAPPGVATVDHVQQVRAAWQDTLGKPPEARIERWLAYLQGNAQSPYVPAVQREIQTLREQITARDRALAAARSEDANARAPRIARLAAQLAIPSRVVIDPYTGEETRQSAVDANSPLAAAPVASAVPGQAIGLAFAIRVPARATRGWLFARTKGTPGFKRTELVNDGDAYLRGTIEPALVQSPGVEWYVEVGGQPGEEPEPVLGSQTSPREIEVERAVGEAPIERGRSHIDAHVDYVDFDGKLGDGFDQYYQAEMDFTYRFLEPIHAVRLGFGTLSGKGGPKDVIDGDTTGMCLDDTGAYRCKAVTFSYVYTEFEHRFRPNVALMLRPQAGLLTTDDTLDTANDCQGASIDNCRYRRGWGARVRLRLGDELATNLVIGAAFTTNVGTLLEAAYHWRPSQYIPVQLAVQVTDMPVPEDFGVRLIADVGYRKLSWFYPSARLSYQARDIDHAGISGGAALNFDW